MCMLGDAFALSTSQEQHSFQPTSTTTFLMMWGRRLANNHE
jgi:hypothetical protein